MSNYIDDDFVAFLAYAGPPAQHDREARLIQIDMAEEFCLSWFKGKPIDRQWAGFYTAYKNWYKREQWKGERHV